MSTRSKLVIGLDFDNTIVCYDDVFYSEARKREWIPSDTPHSKRAIREEITREFGNDRWTELQGVVYSEGLGEARLASGFGTFARWALNWKIKLFVISHKTKFAAGEKKQDLHAPAQQWLKDHGFLSPAGFQMKPDQIYLEETLAAKLKRIADCRCTHYVDDHTDVLLHADFPKPTTQILYDPDGTHPDDARYKRCVSWGEVDYYFKTLS